MLNISLSYFITSTWVDRVTYLSVMESVWSVPGSCSADPSPMPDGSPSFHGRSHGG